MRHEKIILRDGAHQHWHKMAAVKMQLLFETRGSKTFVKTSKIVQRNCQRYLRNFEGDAGEAVVEATEGAGNEAGGEATEGAGGEAIEEGAGGEAVGLAAGETAEGAGGEATDGADSEANEAAANEFFEAAANEAFEEAGAEAEVEALMETMLATVVRFAEIAAGEVAVIAAGEAMETVEDSAMEEEGETFKDSAMQEVDDVTMEETVGDAPVEEAAADVTMEEAVDRRSADFLRAKTGEEKWIVERALYEIGPETEIIAKFDSDACQRASLQGLPNEWLNDEDTHMMGLRDEQLVNEGKRSRRSHFFKSDFMTELTNDGDTEKDGVYEYRNVKHCSKQVPGTFWTWRFCIVLFVELTLRLTSVVPSARQRHISPRQDRFSCQRRTKSLGCCRCFHAAKADPVLQLLWRRGLGMDEPRPPVYQGRTSRQEEGSFAGRGPVGTRLLCPCFEMV
jgi:hypothetical protein